MFLITATGPLAALALEFGPWEFFSLFIFALSMVAGLVEASLLKGLLSGALGLIVTVLGSDPVIGQERLTLGVPFLSSGIDFLLVLIGMFAFAQIMTELERGAPARAAAALEGAVSLAVMTDDPWLFVTRPISGMLLAASAGSVALALWQHRRHRRRATAGGDESADF